MVRYGYTDVQKEQDPFKNMLIERLKGFISNDYTCSVMKADDQENPKQDDQEQIYKGVKQVERGIELLNKAWHAGFSLSRGTRSDCRKGSWN